MSKKLPYTFREALGYGGKKINEEKALKIVLRVGIDAINDLGETPLTISAYLGNVNLLKIIIKEFKRSNHNTAETFGLALLEACDQRQLESIQILVEEGANIEQVDRFGLTPLSKIFTNTFSDPIPSAKYLISKGAEITGRVIKMGMDWESEKFVTFLDSQNIEFDRSLIPKIEVVETEIIDTTIDIKELHYSINNNNYLETAKVIWKKLVPSSGQADTVQGELLRAIEKLRDEAQRNGNCNFSKNCHKRLIKYLKKYLIDKTVFNKEVIDEIKENLKILSKGNQPYTEDDIYDSITNRIIDWHLENPNQIPHIKNNKLYC